jgi:hypothetical protein
MFTSQKHVFWQAFLLAVLVFALGILFGFAIENWRTNQIQGFYQQSELNLLDIRVQNDIYSLSSINCDQLVEENINFGNNIYEQAKLLDRYESASKLSDAIILEHKQYDVLRALFWANAIKTKEKCNASYHNVVYIYSYNTPDLTIKAKQGVFSRILGDLKQEEGDKIMLIPLSGDNNLSSVSLMMNIYNITEKELPVILIDEKTKITNLESKDQIANLLK